MKADQLDAVSFEPAQDGSALAIEKICAREIDCDLAVVPGAEFEIGRFEQFGVGQTKRAFDSQRCLLSRLAVDLSNSCCHQSFLLSVNCRVAGWA